MNESIAIKINSAACRVWFALRVFGASPAQEDLSVLKEATLAQVQTATEVVEAINANAPLVDGKRMIRFTVAAGALPALLAEAAEFKI